MAPNLVFKRNRLNRGENRKRMTALVYTVSLLLAALMGFAVHRASLCAVKTVAEIFSSRRAYMMATLLKAVLWVVAVRMLGNFSSMAVTREGQKLAAIIIYKVLSPHALPAFVALLLGIGVTLLLMRLLTGKTLTVVCTNDICRTEN